MFAALVYLANANDLEETAKEKCHSFLPFQYLYYIRCKLFISSNKQECHMHCTSIYDFHEIFSLALLSFSFQRYPPPPASPYLIPPVPPPDSASSWKLIYSWITFFQPNQMMSPPLAFNNPFYPLTSYFISPLSTKSHLVKGRVAVKTPSIFFFFSRSISLDVRV